MDFLAQRLRNTAPAYIDLPVVNQTGLKGEYDFTFGWTPKRRAAAVADGAPKNPNGAEVPSTNDTQGLNPFESLQSQMGLKLEQRKAPMDVVVIDKVLRTAIDQ
jgi:uncharacterized protein (TIGR03435 family)